MGCSVPGQWGASGDVDATVAEGVEDRVAECVRHVRRDPQNHSGGNGLLTGLQHWAVHHAERRWDFPPGVVQDGNDLAGVLGRLQIRRVGKNERGRADEVTECPDQLRTSLGGEPALRGRRLELGDFLLAAPAPARSSCRRKT